MSIKRRPWIRRDGRRWLTISSRTVVNALALYGLARGFFTMIQCWYGVPLDAFPVKQCPDVVMLLMIAATLGLARVVQSYPLYNQPYRQWLTTTPWTAGMPLPMGPIHLVWRDGFILIPLAAAAYFGSHINPCLPLIVFAAAYLGCLLLRLITTRTWRAVYGIAFGMAAAILLYQQPGLVLFDLAVLCALAGDGVRTSLLTFPWETKPDPTSAPAAQHLGWPLARLGPSVPPAPIPASHAWWTALLAGWWAYSLAAQRIVPATDVGVTLTVTAVIGILAFGRGCIYSAGRLPSCSLLLRLTRGPLILPGYDRIWIATFLILTFIPLNFGCVAMGLPPSVAGALCVAAAFLLAMSVGPSRYNWWLTGEFSLERTAVRQVSRPARSPAAS